MRRDNMRWFIRAKSAEGFVEADTRKEAFTTFVKENPIASLGLVIVSNEKYFLSLSELPETAVSVRTTKALVDAGIWTEDEAMDFNEEIIGKRLV
jgi:hypothetical protein